MINKELLSAVLGIEIVRIHHSGYWLMYWTLYKNGKEKRNQINIHELAFRVRDYFKDRYNYELPMNGKVEEIFTKATQLHKRWILSQAMEAKND